MKNRFFSILRIASGGALLSAATAMGLMAVLTGPSIATADDPANAVHYYVALGDSLAEGFQPNGDFGHGYVDQLYAALEANDPTLQLVNLSCGGETTWTMINGGLRHEGRGARYHCDFPDRLAARGGGRLPARASPVRLADHDRYRR